MTQIRFVLKEPLSKKATIIYLIYRSGGFRIKLSTKEKILPRNWNASKQRPRANSDFSGRLSLISRLENIEVKCRVIIRDFQNIGQAPTKSELTGKFKNVINPTEDYQENGLKPFIEKFIVEVSSVRSVGTIKAYRNTFKHIDDFMKSKSIKSELREVNLDWYYDFVEFLTNQNKWINTIGKQIKNLKVFLNEARERGLNTSPEYRSKRFRVLREDVDKIYLNSDDLDALWNLKLVDNSKLGKVRDVFLIGCYTGLRYSDLRNLRPENVLEKKNIRLKTIKGDKLVVMPIHYRVKLILEKNDWNFPAVISNQKMNEYLKVLGKLAKISESVIIPIKKGNMRTDVTHFKYALISSHTARRSFATNAFLDGVEPLHIMRITGHRTEKAFLRYIRMSEMDNAIKLADHPFFNAPLKLVQQK